MNIIKKYKAFILLLLINILLIIFNYEKGISVSLKATENFYEMIKIIPPIFILIGLFDVWMPKEALVKYMGEHSGLSGILLAFLLGSFTAGPLYGAFPVAIILMKKGCKFTNILIFIGAWSTTKIPLMLFEASSLGIRFAVIRLGSNIVGILIMAYIVDKIVSKKDKEDIYKKASESTL